MDMLKSEIDYMVALARLEEIFDAHPGTEEGKELEQLSLQIENYETLHHPIDPPHRGSLGHPC